MGETGHGASGTPPSGVCSSVGVKLNSSPEPESSQKLPGAALQPAVRDLGCLALPRAIKEAGQFTAIGLLFGILYRTMV